MLRLVSRVISLLRAVYLLVGGIMDAQTRLQNDIDKLSSDLSAISDQIKALAAGADAAVQAALNPIADNLDKVVATADAMVVPPAPPAPSSSSAKK